MNTKYQLIILGHPNSRSTSIKESFLERIGELGIAESSVKLIDSISFSSQYKANAPTVAVYFGGDAVIHPDLDAVNILVRDAAVIIPTVEHLANFGRQIPSELAAINGFGLPTDSKIESLVGTLLEGLSLLRLTRRLFISYRRAESTAVAVQLFEGLEKAGFDVFLDTHSVRPGEVFQDELWHRLVDTDVVVLLDTPDFLGSYWTEQELAKANAMSIGILQLVWPNHTPAPMSTLSIQRPLDSSEFVNGTFGHKNDQLKDDVVETLVSEVESLRARSLAARQDNLVTEFITSAQNLGKQASLQPERLVTLYGNGTREAVIIPTIGVPHAFTYNQSEELVSRIRANRTTETFLLYDHRNIRERWITHLSWLDDYLPIKSIKITEAEQWLSAF